MDAETVDVEGWGISMPDPAPARLRWRWHPRRIASAALALLAVIAASGAAPAPAVAACANPVACENALPGDPPSDWQVNGIGDSSIQGFATSMSVNVGQTEHFKIKTPSTAYHIDILRLGYYGGDGARKIAANITPSATLPQTQPACNVNATTGLIDCGNWGVSASWTVPADAVSGVYIAHLVRDDPQDQGGDSQIPFVVRNDAGHSGIVVKTADAAWEAYNTYGGNSLYSCDPNVACPAGNPLGYKAAFAVSYNRPFDGALTADQGASYLYYAEYQMIRFLEENGYDVSYIADSDVDRNGSLLLNHKLFISSGHDEYWSGNERANVQAALANGVNLAFFSGNEMFWKTRFGPSEDGTNTPYRTLTSYKETHFNGPVDPQDPPTWTGSWGDPRFSPPADGGTPANALTGQEFLVNSGTADITVPYQYSKLRIWRNTAVAGLAAGQSRTLAPGTGTLGYEWDVDADNGFRPPGEIDLSSTTVSNVQPFLDYGSTTGTGTETHHLTLYRAPSGALVFGAGTVQWAWGLDNTNAWGYFTTDPSGNPPDPVVQQATVNVFADMGVQPSTLISGLKPATQSTNTTAPTSTITAPAGGASYSDGTQVTISGNASDAQGVVAGVEVSTNGGTTWHPATLTTADGPNVNWSYSWTAQGNPRTTIMSRAADDSGNIEPPSSGVTVNVSCPCSLWGSATPGGAPDSGDGNAVNVGMKFKSDQYGWITGLRFYKTAADTGTHVGSLWTAGGTLLASATFTNESASGWQQVSLSNPVLITPNTTYVVSYLAPNGHYAVATSYFYPAPSPGLPGGGTTDNPPLHAISNVSSANGLFTYGTSTAFPVSSFQASNYWVDALFSPAPVPGQVTNVSATAGKAQATVSWSAPSGGGPVTTYTITPYIGSTAQPSTTVTGSPPATTATVRNLVAGQSYTFTVTAANPNGSGPASGASNAVTPSPQTPPSAPGSVSASAATSSAVVSWSAPSDDGGSSISGYTITPYIGSSAQTQIQVSNPSATSATVTGLTNGTTYTFTVTANNGVGASPESAPSGAVTPENTIFDFATPTIADAGDPSSVTLGVEFKADLAGWITGVRFYKAAANTGTHVGDLWSTNGTLLASATFTNESAAGWQQVTFSNPVTISAGTTYVASYYAPNGHYSVTSTGLSVSVDHPPLHALANSTAPNGVFAYGGNLFPSASYNASNYYVDAMFQPMPLPGQATSVSATAGKAQATVSWSAPSSGGPVTTYTITPYLGSTAQPSTTVTGSPPVTTATVRNLTGGQSYTFTVTASNPNGSGPASIASNSVTPSAATAPTAPGGVTATAATSSAVVSWGAPSDDGGSSLTGYTITPYIGSSAQAPIQVSNPAATSATVAGLTNGSAYTFTVTAKNAVGASPASAASDAVTPNDTIFDFATPTIADAGDGNALSLGVAFKSDVPGSVTGVRFYKAAANTGTHVGSLWSANGAPLASATFTNETASGWEEVTFSNPVEIAPGTTYVASYYAPNGHYSVSPGGFSSAVDHPPLHALANSATPNGLFTYGGASTFPTDSWNASNYYVDPVFAPNPQASPPSSPSNVTASPATASAQVSWTAPTNDGGSPITGFTITPYVGSSAQTPIQVQSASATSATLSGLTNGTSYTFRVTANNSVGASQPSAPSVAVTPEDTIFDFSTPLTLDSGDTTAATLGVKFVANVSGFVRGIRFYKAPSNTGTHVGALWDSSGNLLASATFTDESSSGWQDVTFSNPVAVTAGTTYVASYFAPNGHYSVTSGGLASAVNNPPLQAVSNSTSPNGVYTYGSSSAFPDSTYNSANYWVDVLFSTS